jgi:hypothetical protein
MGTPSAAPSPGATSPGLCWICRSNPANSGEHRLKASDIRARVPNLGPGKGVFLQRGRATNDPIISPKARILKYPKSLCTSCNDTLTQPYDVAWEKLSKYFRESWGSIVKRGFIDLSKPFPGRTGAAALEVHLFFVKLFGCKIHEGGGVPIDLTQLSQALLTRTAHPEISLTIAADDVGRDLVVVQDSEVHTWQDRQGRIDCAVWLYSVPPVAVKVHYLRAGTPPRVVGRPWHPGRTAKIVRLSPPLGAKVRLAKSDVLLPTT